MSQLIDQIPEKYVLKDMSQLIDQIPEKYVLKDKPNLKNLSTLTQMFFFFNNVE